MKRLFCALFACAAMLVGCGDDDSDFATRPDGKGSSSSVAPGSNGGSEDFDAPYSLFQVAPGLRRIRTVW